MPTRIDAVKFWEQIVARDIGERLNSPMGQGWTSLPMPITSAPGTLDSPLSRDWRPRKDMDETPCQNVPRFMSLLIPFQLCSGLLPRPLHVSAATV
jgi:hypothetical protein